MHFQPNGDMPDDTHLAQVFGGVTRAPLQQPNAEPLDDVFGGVDQSAHSAAENPSHPSDVNRLQAEHTNAGYREGITVAKASSVQVGFDEGFTLGATIGLKAGQLLGTIEAIFEALKGQPGDGAAAAEKLMADAREDLSTARVFGSDYWAPDGNWTYEVVAAAGDDQVLFSDVADAHPLIRKWSQIVDEQVNMWQIQLSLLDDETGPRVDTTSVAEPATDGVAAKSKQTLDW